MRFKHADVHMAFILIVIIIALVVAQSNTTEEIIAAATANATLPSVSDLEPVTNSNAIHLGMLIPLLGPNDWVLDLAFSHDGKLLAAATIKGDVYVWQTQTGSLLSVSSPSTHDLPSSGLSFSPDGSILASSAGSDVILWNIKDISQGKIKTDTVFQNQKSFVRNLDFSPDGTILASRADDGTVRLWDMSTRSSIADFRGDDGGSGALLFSSNGDLLISASQGSDEGSTTYVWSVKTKTRKFTLDGHAPIALSPNSSTLAVWSGGDSPQILIYDLDTQTLIKSLKSKQWLMEISASVFSADGKLLVVGTTWHEMTLWDIEKAEELERIGGGGVDTLTVSPDGKLLAIGYAGSGFTQFVELWGIWKE